MSRATNSRKTPLMLLFAAGMCFSQVALGGPAPYASELKCFVGLQKYVKSCGSVSRLGMGVGRVGKSGELFLYQQIREKNAQQTVEKKALRLYSDSGISQCDLPKLDEVIASDDFVPTLRTRRKYALFCRMPTSKGLKTVSFACKPKTSWELECPHALDMKQPAAQKFLTETSGSLQRNLLTNAGTTANQAVLKGLIQSSVECLADGRSSFDGRVRDWIRRRVGADPRRDAPAILNALTACQQSGVSSAWVVKAKKAVQRTAVLGPPSASSRRDGGSGRAE